MLDFSTTWKKSKIQPRGNFIVMMTENKKRNFHSMENKVYSVGRMGNDEQLKSLKGKFIQKEKDKL